MIVVASRDHGSSPRAPIFFRRVHEQSAGQAGLILGVTAAVAGWFGVAGRTVAKDEESRIERAQAAGEVVEAA